MTDPKQALATQLENLQKRTGKSLAELAAVVKASGLVKHGEIVTMLKRDLGMGHGDANTLVHVLRSPEGAGARQAAAGLAAAAAAAGTAAAPAGDELAAIYAGPKAALLPIHQAVIEGIAAFGPFEIAPKNAYVSLRRKKQLATVGPATRTQVEVGLNMKGVPPTDRLEQLPPGGMCQYRVRLGSADEVDAELLGWIRTAYDAAG